MFSFREYMRIIPLRLLYSGVRSFCRMPDKTAVIIMSEGAEEIEATITIDVLRRGDVKVTVAGLKGKDPVKCARGTVIVPDAALSDVSSDHFDAIILPGGQPGSDSLAAAESVGTLLKKQNEAHRIIAAICAAPIALKSHGIKAQLVTSYPSVRKTMEEGGYKYSEDRVVVSDNIVTSRGPGTAFEFGLKLVELLVGKEKSDSVHDSLLIK